jgi:formylmethanofuran dehydrogenase subunit E
MSGDQIEELRRQIADLKQRWPAHSVTPAMLEELDELEATLQEALMQAGEISGLIDVPVEFGNRTLPVRVIGEVENGFDEPVPPEEIRANESRIVLDPVLAEGLRGLEAGQQLMVVFYFHLSKGFDLLQHPRGDPSCPKRGVFALCSPNRPSPIGVTVAEVVDIQGHVLKVRRLDALNRTPVLDLKPA